MKILTQRDLLAAFKDIQGWEPRSDVVHSWIRAGCPTVPGWKKPRFILEHVVNWLEGNPQPDPIELETRDRMFRKAAKKAS